MRNTTAKFLILFLLLSIFFPLALHYLVLPSNKIYAEEYSIGAGRTSFTFDLSPSYSYVFKIFIPGDSVGQVISQFAAFINGNVVRLCDVDKLEHGVKWDTIIDRKEIKNNGNVIEVAPWKKPVKVAISNCKKIYARCEMFYIGDFYLFYGKNDCPTGYSTLKSIVCGICIAFIWAVVSLFTTKTFWCDTQRVVRFNLYIVALFFILFCAQRVAQCVYGYPFMFGEKCALVLTAILFFVSQVAVIFLFGYEKLISFIHIARRKLIECEKRYQLSSTLVWSFIIIYISCFFCLQVVRHLSFFPSMDLNGMVQLCYNALHGRIWEVQNGYGQQDTYLRYHLQPVYLLFVPLYYVFRSNLVFYFVQTSMIALGALPVYWIASDKMKNKGWGVLFACVYLLYPSIHNCTMYGIHFEELAIGIGLFAFYSLIRGKKICFVVLCLLMLALKENIVAVVFMLGVYAFFRGERVIGICVATVSAGWFYLCLFVIIPHYTPAGQITYSQSFFSNLGGGSHEIIKNMFGSMMPFMRSLVTDPFKSNFLLHLFAPLGFLPLLAPDILLIALPIFAQLLMSDYVRFHDITIFYQSSLVPFVILAAIYGVYRLVALKEYVFKKLFGDKKAIGNSLLGCFLLVSVLFYSVKNIMPEHRPGYFVEGVYSISPRDIFIKKYLDRISDQASVAAPMMYYEYLSGRRNEHPLPPETLSKYNPDVVMVNSYICWPAYGEYRYNQRTISYLKQSAQYMPILQANGFYIFEKKDAVYKTGMCVQDYLGFRKEHNAESGEYSFTNNIELAEDGDYLMTICLARDIVCATTERNGYDSFEYLPGFKDVALIAQSFTPGNDCINAIDVFARRVGMPCLSLSLREDNNGKPADDDIIRVVGKRGDGILFKYAWIRFDVGSLKLDPLKKYWVVLSAKGDAHKNRYDIAAFSKDVKGAGYADKALFQYYDSLGEWREPYVRNQKTDDEEGNYINGIIFRSIMNAPAAERIIVKVDDQEIQPRMMCINKSSKEHNVILSCDGIVLTRGIHKITLSSHGDFQLGYIELLKRKQDMTCYQKNK